MSSGARKRVMLSPGVTHSVPVNVSGFTGALAPLNRRKAVRLTSGELAVSAVEVGFNIRAMPGVPGFLAALLRVAALHGLLESDGPRLVRDAAVAFADASEKRVLTYYIGMTVAHAVSAKLLGTLFLAHVDLYGAAVGLPTSGPRPDLLGLTDRGRWIIVEAKGRSSSPSAAARSDTKTQASLFSARLIGGGALAQANVAAITYFTPAGRLRTYFSDPPPTSAAEVGIGPEDGAAIYLAQSASVRAGLLEARGFDQGRSRVPMTLRDGTTVDYDILEDASTRVSVGLPTDLVLDPSADAVLGYWRRMTQRPISPEVLYGRFDPTFDSLNRFPVVTDDRGREWTVGPSSIAVRRNS